MKTIDLSHELFHGFPSYPSDPNISVIKKKDVCKDFSMLHGIQFGTHSGTHLDAPSHIFEGGKTLSDFPLNAFWGTGVLVDKEDYLQLTEYNDQIDAVIFDTGWYKNIDNPNIFFGKSRPVIPEDLIQFIIEKKIKIFGCDLPSVDASGSKDKFVHKSLLKNDVIIYEALTNLNQLEKLKPFDFYGFPLSFNNLDGSPVRAVAIIDK